MEIKLLDGSRMDVEDLEKKAIEDDFYYGWLNKRVLSSSVIKLLNGSFKTYHYIMKYGQEETPAILQGRLLHTMILEPEKLDDFIFVNVQSKNTNAYREAKQYHPNVFTIKEKQDAERLADALLKNENALKLLQGAEFEVPRIKAINGYAFRGKADVLHPDKKPITLHNNATGELITYNVGLVDLKTTIDVRNFELSADNYSYSAQAYIYCKLFNMSYENFIFLTIDKKNLNIGVHPISETFYERGKHLVEQAIKRYEMYIKEDFDINDETFFKLLV